MGLRIDGASAIEHRVDTGSSEGNSTGADSGIELLDVEGATQVGDLRTIGRTRSLVLQPDRSNYGFRYRARLSQERESRCPLWLPTVPTDGQSRAVTLRAELPVGSAIFSSMPAFEWTGTHGEVTLGNLPAFVHLSFGSQGASVGWGIGAVMDTLTLVVIAGASAMWLWRRKR